MKIEDIVDLYLESLKKLKRFSINTVRAYNVDLRQFTGYCNSVGKNEIQEINIKFLRRYLMLLNEIVEPREKPESKHSDKKEKEKTSTLTVSRKLSAVRGLFNFALRENFIKENPAANLVGPKIKRKLPDIFSEDEYEEILNQITQNENSSHQTRNLDNTLLVKAIFEILYSSAIRVSELCGLNINDIDFSGRTIKVLGKGSKERIVPVGNLSLQYLKDYLKTRSTYSFNSPVFISSSGKRITPRLVHKIVNKYLSKVGDRTKNSPHILRHSAATHMLDHGADLIAVKEILGHENLSTTQIYTHVSVDRLKKIYKQAHPKS
jgi:site-specific recombinase XerD